MTADYELFVEQLGMTQDQIDAIVHNESDLTPLEGDWHVYPSPIHGKGVFLLRWLTPGESLGKARINGKRTPLGRWVNHSPDANLKWVKTPCGDIEAVAIRHVAAGEELTVDYRQAALVNLGRKLS